MKRKIFILTALVMMIFCVNACAFSDVQSGSWYYDNVTDMTNQGYLSGYEDGTFRPDGTVTKAELVSIVGRIAGLQESAKQNNHWADGMVQTALTKGLFDWDEIPPTAQTYDEPITRQLAVKIVMNAFFKEERGDYNRVSSSVSDFAQLDGRYYDSMIAAYCKGIVYGDDKGNLNPKSSITRAEACAIIMRAASMKGDLKPYEPTVTEQPKPQTTRKGGVSENGALHVDGTQLMNENNEPVVLHGMSSHGLQWFGNFATENAVKATADYGANLFRCAMYTDEGGYISNPSVKDTLINAVDSAIRQDMYVIIDWHILSDGNPMQHIDDAVDFFGEMSSYPDPNRHYAMALASIIYDVLDDYILHASIHKFFSSERAAALEHLKVLEDMGLYNNSIIIFDRGYYSEDMFRYCVEHGHLCVMRLKEGINLSKKCNGDMISVLQGTSKEGTSDVPIRVLEISLDDGTKEYLATNLFDPAVTKDMFRELYFYRWPVELKYKELKSRFMLYIPFCRLR